MSEVKLIRLITGEDILATVKYHANDAVTLMNPVRIVIIPKPNGQQPDVGFAIWIPYAAAKEFNVDRTAIVVITDPINEFIDQYSSMNSGLALPPKSKLIIPGA